jgi:hypothetical protein
MYPFSYIAITVTSLLLLFFLSLCQVIVQYLCIVAFEHWFSNWPNAGKPEFIETVASAYSGTNDLS